MQRIPSIHKYCNRWCERCPFQGRCAFYIAKQEDSQEIDWSEGLEERLSEEAPHPFQSLDLNQAEALQKQMEAREKAGPFDIQKSPLTLFFNKWHKKYQAALIEFTKSAWAQKLAKQAFLKDLDDLILDNSLQVMRHYSDFIGPKITRALGGKHDELNMASSIQSDWNGSAKVACLALKHLRLAFEDLLEKEVLNHDELIDLLGDTNRLIKLLYFEFPELDLFVRPGFDAMDDKRLRGSF